MAENDKWEMSGMKLDCRNPMAPLVYSKGYEPNTDLPSPNIEVGDMTRLSVNQREFDVEVVSCNGVHYAGIVKDAAPDVGLPIGANVDFGLDNVFFVSKR